MKKRDRERRYKSLLEKDYSKALISDLAVRFDFTQDSWMCRTIVDKFNQTLENWEKENHIERLKPGDLLLPYKEELIVVPLFDKGAIDILVETKLFQPYKKRMIDKVFNLLKSIDNQARLEDVHSLISLRDTIPRSQPGTHLYDLEIDPSFPLINPDDIELRRPERKPANIHIHTPPIDIKNNLINYCVEQLGLKPFVAQNILDYFLERRSYFLPIRSTIQPGQFIWLGTSYKKSKKVGCVQLQRKQIPIVLTLYSPEEISINTRPKNLIELNEQMMNQLARITTEAYMQETLLSDDELQLFYLRSATVISKLIRKYMKVNKVILPTPGSILDAGTMFTHKELIIDLSMQGYYTKEIAKKTYHDPRSVDSYLKVFNAILVLWYYNLPLSLISMVIEKGIKVVNEHINILTKYFPDKGAIKNYLNQLGIAV
jgi:hypothetical protein